MAHWASVRQHFAATAPKAAGGEYREHYRKIGQEAAAEVYNSVRYAALLDPYVQRVFGQIRAANPEPNAHALGNGTAMLNIS